MRTPPALKFESEQEARWHLVRNGWREYVRPGSLQRGIDDLIDFATATAAPPLKHTSRCTLWCGWHRKSWINLRIPCPIH